MKQSNEKKPSKNCQALMLCLNLFDQKKKTLFCIWCSISKQEKYTCSFMYQDPLPFLCYYYV